MHTFSIPVSRYVRGILLSAVAGVLAGIAAATFLILLELATKARESNSGLFYLLPLGGFIIGWVYYQYGAEAKRGTNLILDEIHDPKATLPIRMAPFVLVGTVLTHLFGGSAGREGTAVQMAASLADQVSGFFKVGSEERKHLLVAGAGAGFGAAIGAPFAGILFGMEMISIGRLKLIAPLECGVASFLAYYTSKVLGAPHSIYPAVSLPPIELSLLFFVMIAGLSFGIAARGFVFLTHAVERFQQKWVPYPPLRPCLAGILLLVLYRVEGTYQYAGLGIPVIQRALEVPSSFPVPILKALFTALTIGSGFKGGEFIPMVYIGTTLGSALSQILPVAPSLLAALGFAAVFGAGANTPIACTVMAMEIFGPKIGLYAALACYTAYQASGHSGIYPAQRVHRAKWRR